MRRRIGVLLALVLTIMVPLDAAPAASAANVADSIVLLMDTSGSMKDGDGGGTVKIEGAKAGVISLLDSIPMTTRVGLMTYPGDHNCGDPVTRYALAPLEARAFANAVSGLPNPEGNTPTGPALKKAAEALAGQEGSRTIILVSDGLSNCGPPPCQVAKDIAASGINVTVNTIAFKVNTAGQNELACIAQATGGRAVTADDSTELKKKLVDQARVSLGLSIDIPPSVSVSSIGATVRAVVTNEGGPSASGVALALTPTTGGVMLGVLHPVVEVGNLAKGESRQVSWTIPTSPLLAGKTVPLRVTARSADGAAIFREGVVAFSAADSGQLGDASAFKSFKKVVVLGDSFSAGDGAYSVVTGYADYDSATMRADCRRSHAMYAQVLFGEANVLNLACTGAVTSNLATSNDLSGRPQYGDMTQLQTLDYRLSRGDRFDAVFVTIGGNDVGFADVVVACADPTFNLLDLNMCAADRGSKTYDVVGSTLAATKTLMRYSYHRIALTFARNGLEVPPIIVSPYPVMTPNNPTVDQSCTWGGFVQNGLLSREHLLAFADFQRRVDDTVAAAVKEAKDAGEPVYLADDVEWIMQPNHSACSHDPWVNPITYDRQARGDSDEKKDWSTPLHPNLAGHKAWALALARWSETSGPLRGAVVADSSMTPRALAAAPAGRLTSSISGQASGPTVQGANTVEISGLQPDSPVGITLNSTPYPVAVGFADAQGRFVRRVNLDAEFAAPGPHTLILAVTRVGADADVERIPVSVLPSVPWLWWAGGVLGLVLVGAAFVLRRGSGARSHANDRTRSTT